MVVYRGFLHGSRFSSSLLQNGLRKLLKLPPIPLEFFNRQANVLVVSRVNGIIHFFLGRRQSFQMILHEKL